MSTLRTAELNAAVDAILARAGRQVTCATPLGLGKPVPLLNALYARIKADRQLKLSILTALSLDIPRAGSDLERRFVDPFVARVFAGVPRLEYLRDLCGPGLPPNIELFEFYFRPGSMLGVPAAQANYVSSNYTHAARDMLARGLNAVAVMISERDGRYSLSCNPDLTIDVVQALRKKGAPCVVAGCINRNLPFMTGDAEVAEDFFDILVDSPACEHPLFGVPNPLIEPAEHAIGVRAAALVKDGGTLQLGIGSVGDSVAHWLGQRHSANTQFRQAAHALGLDGHPLIEREGGRAPFSRGLFASSEMFTWGMMTLFRAGVIRRRASDDTGPVLQAAFFLGPGEFYRALRELTDEQRDSIRMTSVSSINDLFGEETLARQQRRDARFINICMMVTLSGAATSDGLADGRVVSGVGGQYNFVAQAHELEGARSILLLRSTRESAGRTESNIVFNYGHTTIPRHLRDIVVTEYGIADLRGKSDAEIAIALISIADARFQEALAEQAKRAGKLPSAWQIPEVARSNTPDRLDERLAPLAARGLLPPFPLGTDFDAVEQRLVPALSWLKRNAFGWRNRLALATAALTTSPAPEDRPALERLGLAVPKGWRERALRGVVAHGLNRTRRSP